MLVAVSADARARWADEHLPEETGAKGSKLPVTTCCFRQQFRSEGRAFVFLVANVSSWQRVRRDDQVKT